MNYTWRYPLIITALLISGCNEKKADLAPEGGKYFVASLGENVNLQDIEGKTSIEIMDGDYNYRYGSLNGKLSDRTRVNRLSTHIKDDINIYATPAIKDDHLTVMNSNGVLTKFTITSEGKVLKLWQKSAHMGFASELSTGIKDNVVVATCGDNSVMGFDLESGKAIWNTVVDSPIASKPLFRGDSVVFFAKNDAVYSINYKSGELQWYIPNVINANNRSLFSANPLLIEGYIIQQTYDDQVYAINPENGHVELVVSISNPYKNVQGKEFLNHYGNIAYDRNNKTLYLNNSSGAIVKLRLNSSTPDWIMPAVVSKPVWLLDNIILAVNDLGSILALSKSDGKIIWSNNLLKKIIKKSNEKDIFGTPKAYNEISLTPPIVIDGKIIVISSNKKLIIISPENGRILEVKDYKEDIFGQPFVYNGIVYIIKDNGRTILQL